MSGESIGPRDQRPVDDYLRGVAAERERILDALGKRAVLMRLADGRNVSAVPWSAVDDLIGHRDGE